jgi:hypothetical protein
MSFSRRLIAAIENAADAFTNAARRSVTLDRLIALQKQNLPNAISANIVIPLPLFVQNSRARPQHRGVTLALGYRVD